MGLFLVDVMLAVTRNLVRYVATEFSSEVQLGAMRVAFENIEALCLDLVHLSVKYQTTCWGKNVGSTCLFSIGARFSTAPQCHSSHMQRRI